MNNIDNDKLFDAGVMAARLYSAQGSVSAKKYREKLHGAVADIQSAYKTVEAQYGGRAKIPSAAEWFLDNRYLALREAKIADGDIAAHKRLRASREGAVLFLLSESLLKSCGGVITAQACRAFLEGVQSEAVLPHKELYLFPAALRYSLVIRIADTALSLTEEDADTFAALFTSLRSIAAIDMQKLLESVDVCEKLLMSDPAGVYPRMDDDSRAYYRERLYLLAEESGESEHEFAENLLETCKRSEGALRHVGAHLLPEPMGGGLYIACNVLLTLILTLLCAFLSHSTAAALLLLLPISELTKSLLDNVLTQLVKPARLPKLDVSHGVPEEGKSVCVISALLSSRDNAEKLARSLEDLRLSNRAGGSNLLFGLLADLPEAEKSVTSKDTELISSAAKCIEALNEKYGGGFYLFTRPRTYDRSIGIYSGFERKRGAVLALAKLLTGKRSELRVSVGDVNALHGAKYIITLDSDTKPYPDSLTELIGTMLHPLNTPVLDRERGIVTAGHGILHPRMSTTLRSVSATDFSRLFAGLGGSEPYNALSGELYMDYFRRGGFSGKGIIDAECLLVCSEAHIPEGRILSHDAPEGAYLRGGYVSDVEFSDSFPASPISYYRRSHRWIRGDWQNIGFIFSRYADLPDIERFKFFDSLRRSMVSVFTFAAVFLGLIYPKGGLVLAASAALLALCSRLLIALTEFFSLRSGDSRRRYHSRLIHGMGAAIAQTIVRLWLLPYEAWISLSAAVSALWRMGVSHTKLLQWETSAQSDLKKRGLASYLLNMWFAPISGTALLIFSSSVPAIVAGLFWLTAPLCALALSTAAKSVSKPSIEQRGYITRCAADIWSYFESFCIESENYLPPDNFQEQPPVGIAHRTSPTNMGFALVSALCAMDLGLDRGTALPIIGGMLDTLEKLPKWRGHFYNWYDTLTLRPLTPKYISTVDSGNLCASLITLKNGLYEHHRPELAKRVEKLLVPMDFAPLYDKKRCLFRIGMDLEKNEPSPAHYDLLAGEARLTSYLAVAKGDVPRKHWRALSRALRRSDGYSGMASWTGTMFEYLMPELFLPLCPDSLMSETAAYCLHVQKKRKSPTGVWGISESAYYALDPALNYRYKAHGCGALALKRGQDSELVISPYSSFLALAVKPDSACKNLIRLEETGAVGRFGFMEALDFTESRSGEKGERVRCYMAHHLGMSMLAAANFLKDGIVSRRFMAEPSMRAYSALLEEKLPLNAPVLQLAENDVKREFKSTAPWTIRGSEIDFENPRCTVLSNGRYSVMSTESAVTKASMGDMLIYRSPRFPIGEGHGAELHFEYNGCRISLLPEANVAYDDSMWELGNTQLMHSLEQNGIRSTARLSVSGSENGELRSIRISADRKLKGRLIFSFEPVLANVRDYVNHPAYWRLGTEAHTDAGVLVLHRLPRGNTGHCWLCLAADRPISLSADRYGELGQLSAPYITASAELDLDKGEAEEIRLALCVSDSFEAAYVGVQRMLSESRGDFGVIPSICASRLGMDAAETGKAMEMLCRLWFPVQGKNPWVSKEKLWRFGISGDLPIFCVPLKTDIEDIKKALLRFCLLSLCSVSSDLVIISADEGEYAPPTRIAVTETLTEFGLEALMDCGGGVHILPLEAEDVMLSCAWVIYGEESAKRKTGAKFLLPENNPRRYGAIPDFSFTKNGSFRFYVNSNLPPRSWAHILTNGKFSCLATDSGTGNMWYENAREAKINHWLNDPYAVIGPETLECRIGDKRYSLFAANDGIPCRVSYDFGCAVWEKRIGETGLRTTAFIPEGINARVLIIEAIGEAEGEIHWKTELTLSSDSGDYPAVRCNYVNPVFHASSERFPMGGELLISSSAAPEKWTADALSALRGEYDGRTWELSVPCFAAVYKPRKVLVLICGVCTEEEQFKLCKPADAIAALEQTKKQWRHRACGLKIQCGSSALEHYMNGWAVYQTLACRLMGRGSMYQSGGAFGFRDQLQDALNLLLISPAYAKNQILLSCEHQYFEGDVMHWWHSLPSGNKGVRTRCSDDLLWLVWALCEYVEKTGDTAFCSAPVNYVNSNPLSVSEHDRYETPQISDLSESVIDHAKRAVDLCISRGCGDHGLLYFGSGDWNDGMDKVGGESVWLSFFFAHTVKRFSELLMVLCKPDSDYYRGVAEKIGRAANDAWDGDRYLRGYWRDGTPLGSVKNSECRIDSVVQSWAAFCADASNSRIDTALDTALHELYDRENGIIKLFTPPFAAPQKNPGYILSYGAGFRENGGQYTHAAIWLAMACIRRGRVDEGWSILRDILPENHDLRRYMAEPFVIPADVYTAANHTGEAGWTWYTGSSGWYFRVVCEEILGLRLWGGMLYIRPSLPAEFPRCKITLGGLDIEIGECEIIVNGEKYDGKGIPYA